MSTGLQTRFAPSFRLIQAHFALGLLGMCAFAAALAASGPELTGFFFQPLFLALVHLCVLGWLMPIAIGALHQLVPVVFEVPVRSEKVAWAALGFYAAGLSAFVPLLWGFELSWPLAVAAGFLAGAMWLYVLNLVGTLARSSQWRTLTGAHVLAAFAYLLAAVTVGALLAANLVSPFIPLFHLAILRAHAHLAGLGFFGLLIMGVAYRLLEMFLLSHGAPQRWGWTSFVAINLALWVLVPTFVFQWGAAWVALGVVLAGVGVGGFLVQVQQIHARRMQRRPDIAWTHTFTGFAYLAAVLLVGIGAALTPIPQQWSDRLTAVYGLLALPGFIGTVVVGQLYKIVPFLVWLHRFSPYVGLKKVPTAGELLSERPKQVQYALMHAGLWAIAAGMLADVSALRIGGALSFAASAALLGLNLAVVNGRRP